MEIISGSRHLLADIATALDVAGREHLVVAIKAAWSIPLPGQRPKPLPPQPLVQADEYYGEPGFSAFRYGSDFPRFKARCDVLFDACAHSPDGQPVKELIAGWSVGELRKVVRVVGDRRWEKLLGVFHLTKPKPFVSMPLHYGLAFGGSRYYQRGEKQMGESLQENPAGAGWAGVRTIGQMNGAPAPNLEDLQDPISGMRGHRPIAFSGIGRDWLPRRKYCGTYDDAWLRDVFPFLPKDYDERFHQCAPKDQQMAYPKGGELVTLLNMMAERPKVRFRLPRLDNLKVRVLRTDYSHVTLDALPDTLFFEPDAGRFSVVWRVSTPLKRRIQEIGSIAVGPVDPAWWAAKITGTDGGGGCRNCGDKADDKTDDKTSESSSQILTNEGA
jgi:hypothetical protein